MKEIKMSYLALDYPYYNSYYGSRYYSPYYGSRYLDYSYVSPARSYVYDYPVYTPAPRVETTVTTTTVERPALASYYPYSSYYPYTSSYYSPYRSYYSPYRSYYSPYALDRAYTTHYLWAHLFFSWSKKWLIFEWIYS